MSKKKPTLPVWYKNTYFWISGVLFILAVVGLAMGQDTIRDPGQKHENGLVWLYLIASVVMLVNGLLSHRQTIQQYNEETQG